MTQTKNSSFMKILTLLLPRCVSNKLRFQFQGREGHLLGIRASPVKNHRQRSSFQSMRIHALTVSHLLLKRLASKTKTLKKFQIPFQSGLSAFFSRFTCATTAERNSSQSMRLAPNEGDLESLFWHWSYSSRYSCAE